MGIDKLQQIRQMTERIAEFVDTFNIEGCQQLLEQRLVLLNEVQQELSENSNDTLQLEYTSLLAWLAEFDKTPFQKTHTLRAEYQEKLSQKKKANFAIEQYTKF